MCFRFLAKSEMQESVVFGCVDNSPGSDRTDRRLHNSGRLALRDVFCEHILWEDCVSSGNRLMGWTSLAYFVRGTFQPFPSNSAGGRPRAGAPFWCALFWQRNGEGGAARWQLRVEPTVPLLMSFHRDTAVEVSAASAPSHHARPDERGAPAQRAHRRTCATSLALC